MNAPADPKPSLFLRLLRFAPTRLAILYFALTYLYLSGFFYRKAYTHGPFEGLVATLMAGAMMLAVYALIVLHVERRPVRELAPRPLPRELAFGLLLGVGLYSACVLVLAVNGNYRVHGLEDAHILLGGMATALATGVFEELLFRAGVFRLAEEWFGSWAALVISSAVFGFAHAGADGATLQGLVSISVWAGLLLAATYLWTGRLWLGIGFHAAWNYTQGTVYSGIVSGNAPSHGFVKSTLDGPEWLTGGAFGVEASVVAMLICTAAGVWMLVRAIRLGRLQPPAWRRKARSASSAAPADPAAMR